MAQLSSNKSLKRKNFGATKDYVGYSASKLPKFAGFKRPEVEKKRSKEQLKSSDKNKCSEEHRANAHITMRDRRQRVKELTEIRKKKRKRHYILEQELAFLWEKMRCRNIAKEERSNLITEALTKMKGNVSEIARSHISSRVLQTCIKYCSQSERDAVFSELRPHFITLATNAYSVHLLKKMLDNASKQQLGWFISSLRGHVASLLRHMVGSVVVEHVFQLGTATQKQHILMELYSTELQLFKDSIATKETRLPDLITKLGLQKASVLRHMTSVIQPILEKGIIDHSVTHRALVEYLSISNKSSAEDVIQQLSGPLLVRMIHTKAGSRIGILCVKHGSPKERKKIVKGMKGHIAKIALDQYGSMVLACIFSVLDDTKLVTKIAIKELRKGLKDLALDKNGRRSLMQLLHPNSSRCFNPDDMDSFGVSIPSLSSAKDDQEVDIELTKSEVVPGSAENGDTQSKIGDNVNERLGKKDCMTRRRELLVDSGLAESLIDLCTEFSGEFLKSKFGKEIIYVLAIGGADGILHPMLDEKIAALHKAIAFLASQPKSEGGTEHVLEDFHSSRVIRKLVLDSSLFASTLWHDALEGRCGVWVRGHSCKVVSAYLESTDQSVRNMAEGELQPLVDNGILSMPTSKLSGA